MTSGGERNEVDSMDQAGDGPVSSSNTMAVLKSLAACAFCYSAFVTYQGNHGGDVSSFVASAGSSPRRQLSMVGDGIPAYMDGLMKDLRERKKLFDETPEEEVKYWFEYTGSLQVSCLERGKNKASLPSSCQSN